MYIYFIALILKIYLPISFYLPNLDSPIFQLSFKHKFIGK